MTQNSATPANARQVGGDHYKTGGLQHWDLAVLFQWDPFQYQITKYVMRWRGKNGIQDLEKCRHFVDKYIEEVKAGRYTTGAHQTLGKQSWLDMLGVEHAASPLAELRDMLGAYCGWETEPRNALRRALNIHTELSALVGCGSPDGTAELNRVAELVEAQVFEFSEDEVPTFRQGTVGGPQHELEERVTAERCRGLVERITELQEAVVRGREFDNRMPPQAPPGYFIAPIGSLQPTAWKCAVFEATKDGRDLFRCRACRAHFSVPEGLPPVGAHVCAAPAEDSNKHADRATPDPYSGAHGG